MKDGGEVTGDQRVELELALAVANRANNASVHEEGGRWTVIGDPTEAALIVAARRPDCRARSCSNDSPASAKCPFSSERSLMSTVHTDATTKGRVLVFTKGAPDVLLARCTHERVGTERNFLKNVSLAGAGIAAGALIGLLE